MKPFAGVAEPPAGREREHGDGPTLTAVRWAALAVFLGIPVLGLASQRWAGRVVWTVAVASLPLLIVLAGYHPWRRICPLAWLAQLPASLGYAGQGRASPWLQANYYYVMFALLLLSLWLRLTGTNGHGVALAAFFVALSLAALASGAVFTGKAWCNYVCPVSFVEKVYTEPRGLRPTPNSECATCTACKPACPDINQENGYWKDILAPHKRFAYFAFPGLVFAFYVYYWLQAGSWDYYFSGSWTNQPEVLASSFLPGRDAATAGFFFLPSLPRAAAALITLGLGALLSYSAFRGGERRLAALTAGREGWDAGRVRHVMFAAAAFTAFVTFYSFAGAPTVRLVPGAPHLLQVLTVGTATLFLVRRFARLQTSYAEETLARQIVRRWAWTDMEPPKDLRQALLIHRIRSQTHTTGYARLLEVYKGAVREVVASGLISRAQVQRLESLRDQLQISRADHEKVMADLDDEERARIRNPALDVSPEKRLQLEAYARALRAQLEGAAGAGAPDDRLSLGLRQAYGVTREEHAAVLEDLLGTGGGVGGFVLRAFETIEAALGAVRSLREAPSPAGPAIPRLGEAGELLADALLRRAALSAGGLMRAVAWTGDEQRGDQLRRGLLSEDEGAREAAVEELAGPLADVVARRLVDARREAAARALMRAALADHVRPQLASSDPYVRAAALYVLSERGEADEQALSDLIRDEHEVVREAAIVLLLRAKEWGGQAEARLVIVERMIALRSVPLFAGLAPEDLATLAQASRERQFAAGAALCVEGEPGDEVFVILSGEATVLRQTEAGGKAVGRETTGAVIGELAVLDPGARAATVLAGSRGTRVLCLGGGAFREVLRSNPSVVGGVMSALVGRIRGGRRRLRGAGAAESDAVPLHKPGS